MRRLASRTREDAYISNRDYQTLQEVDTQAVTFTGPGPVDIVLTDGAEEQANSNLIGFGGFFRPNMQATMRVRLTDGQVTEDRLYSLRLNWNRIGLLIETDARNATVTITLDKAIELSFWGVGLARLNLPDAVSNAHPP